MTRLKDATFESNSITGTDAFTSSVGSPTVDGTSKIKGVYCARTNWTASANVNGIVSGLSETEMWISQYLYIAAYPAATSRIWTTSNGSTQFNLTMTSAGVITVRIGSTTVASSILTYSLSTIYRLGVHIKNSTALPNADAQIEIFSATGDTAFGAATSNTTDGTMVTSNSAIVSVVWGQNNGAAATGDLFWDDLRIDNVSMPGPSVPGAPWMDFSPRAFQALIGR